LKGNTVTPPIITLERPITCEYIIAMFYDGMMSSSEAHRLIELSEDDASIKEQAEDAISAYYGP
jgi:hypothetical protein